MTADESMTSRPPERLLSPDDVAAFLGVPVTTLYQWRYKGVGPRGLRIGRHLRYRQDEVDAWLRTLAADNARRQSA